MASSPEIARQAGSYGFLCKCGGCPTWAHSPVGEVIAHVTPEQHRAAFSPAEFEERDGC